MIPYDKLSLWLDLGLNILLEGRHGVGKTSIILDVCHQKNLVAQYYSASTLDPWADIGGIPRPVLDKKDKEYYIENVKAKHFAKDEVDVLIFDELNRSAKKVRNFIMELVQFRSINGKKFNRIKSVIGIINPYDDRETYDVEPMDPAQLDRFQIHYNVEYIPYEPYFEKKYGVDAKIFLEYWHTMPKEQTDLCSPRRLDYAAEMYKRGHVDLIHNILPMVCNPQRLIDMLQSQSIIGQLDDLARESDKKKVKKWFNDPNNFDGSIEAVIANQKYLDVFLPHFHKERLSTLFKAKKEVRDVVTRDYEKIDVFREVISDIGESIIANVKKES